jgi:hypothetical protein
MTEQQRATSEMVEKMKAAILENIPKLILTADQLNLVDKWIAATDPKIDRSEAIRRLVELGLKVKGK